MRIDSLNFGNFGLSPKLPGVTEPRVKAQEDEAVQAPAPAALPPPPVTMASASSEQTNDEEESAEKTLIEQILEGGFTKFVEEIKRRMEAAAALRKDKNDPTSMPGTGTTSLTLPTGNLALGPQMTNVANAGQGTGTMGLGPLLALQETNEKTGKTTPADEHLEPEHKAVKKT